MKLKNFILAAFALPLFLVSCSDDDNADVPSGAYDNGVLILNQGGYLAGNASVSFLKGDFTVENNIFSTVNNGLALGDVAQDINFYGQYAYIVVNNSNKIEVVNRYSFQRITSITTGINNPRYITFTDGKGYVTNWGNPSVATDDYVAVINPETNVVTANIPVGEGPEKIVAEGGKLYVALKGGYGSNNKIAVINPATSAVTTNITVGDVPGSMEVVNGKLYVLAEGNLAWTGNETSAKLQAINLETDTVAGTLTFADGVHPGNLVKSGSTFFYAIDSKIFKVEAGAATVPATPLATTPAASVSAMAVINGMLYVGDALNFASAGKVYIYSLNGNLEHTLTAGIAPAGFYINE